MRILVLHRVPGSFARYAENIDHERHDVTYVGVAERLASLPPDVTGRRVERPGTGDTATEVLSAIRGRPVPDVVVALSEYDLLAAGQVRDALGVPGPSESDVVPVRDKVVMKSTVAAAGLRVPGFLGLGEALLGGPVPWAGRTVLKPLAGASSEGIRVFATPAEALATVAADGTDPAGFEIEEFVDGPILHVDGLMAAGEPVAVVASEYVGTCLDYAAGAPLGSVQIDPDPALHDWTLRCLRALGIANGPFHLEGVVTSAGMVFLEVGARFGGADVVDAHELATGVRLPAAHVRLLVDGPGEPPAARVPGPGERYGWFVVPGHTLGAGHCRIEGEQPFRDDPLVHRWVQRGADEPIAGTITYADDHVPMAGVVGPAPTAVLRRFLTGMFASVKVLPAGPGRP